MSTKKWRPEITVHFIEEYEKYPCLWDPNNRNYKRREIRSIALKHIISALAKHGIKLTDESAKAKIRNLRNTYINELRKMAESKLSGTDKVYKTNLCWFKEADQFLRNVVKIPDTVAQNCDIENDDDDILDAEREVVMELLKPNDGIENICEQTLSTDAHSEDTEIIFASPQPPTLVCEKTSPLLPKLPKRKSPEPEIPPRKLSPDPEDYKRNLSPDPIRHSKRLSPDAERHDRILSADLERINRRRSDESERPNKIAKFSFHASSHGIHKIEDNEFVLFGQSVAFQMRKLPLEHALELQAEIQNAIVQRRLKVLRQAEKAAQKHSNIVGSSSELVPPPPSPLFKLVALTGDEIPKSSSLDVYGSDSE